MKKTSFDFSPPPIIGVLGDSKMDPSFAKKFERDFRARGIEVACLPFRVEKRHLKNVVACMKLIDVVGLIVHKSHCQSIMRHLPTVERAARDAGFADVVIRRGKKFIGMNVFARAVEEIIIAKKCDIRKIKRAEIDRVRRKICIDLMSKFPS